MQRWIGWGGGGGEITERAKHERPTCGILIHSNKIVKQKLIPITNNLIHFRTHLTNISTYWFRDKFLHIHVRLIFFLIAVCGANANQSKRINCWKQSITHDMEFGRIQGIWGVGVHKFVECLGDLILLTCNPKSNTRHDTTCHTAASKACPGIKSYVFKILLNVFAPELSSFQKKIVYLHLRRFLKSGTKVGVYLVIKYTLEINMKLIQIYIHLL